MPEIPSALNQWLDHPEVKVLIEKLNELLQTMSQYEEQMQPIMDRIHETEHRRDAFLASIKEQLREYDLELYQANELKKQIQDQLAVAKRMRDGINASMYDIMAKLEADKALAEAEEEWELLLAKHEWVWKEYIRNYQRVGTKFMAGCYKEGLLGRLNADQMGLGKTLQAAAAVDMIEAQMWEDGKLGLDENASVLWLLPNAIKAQTWLEIKKWSPERNTVILQGAPGVRENIVNFAHSAGMTLIANYEALNSTPAIMAEEYDMTAKSMRDGFKILKERKWDIVVMDEAHAFKNDSSLTFQWVEEVCKNAGVVLPMTGTPILNKPQEFWAILHMCTLGGKYEGRFEHKWRFIQDYCYQYGSKVRFYHGAAERLMKQVSDLVIRRRLDEVEIEMPKLNEIAHTLTMPEEQRAVYDQMRDEFRAFLDSKASTNVTNRLSWMLRLRQINVWPAGVAVPMFDEDGEPTGEKSRIPVTESSKLSEAMEIIRELVSNGEKVLVFSNFNDPLLELQRQVHEDEELTWPKVTLSDDGVDTEDFPVESRHLIGGMNEDKKAEAILSFNDPESNVRVMVGNIKAMGIGLNLQNACSNAIFLDLWWNDGINQQALARIYRPGQEKPVTIHYMKNEDSIDAYMDKVISEKLDDAAVMERSELRKAIDDGLI